MAIFQRLMGLETEYAIRLPQQIIEGNSGIHTHRDAYEAVSKTLRSRLPTADASPIHSGKHGLFLGTGGAVWFETVRPSLNLGLIEGATPECRDPCDLVACQRAQDRLLGEITKQFGLALIKNCRDAEGHTYGAQESYEVQFASGWRLSLWRVMVLTLMLGISLLANFVAGVFVILAMLLVVPFTLPVAFVIGLFQPSRHVRLKTFDWLVGQIWRRGWNQVEIPVPGFLASFTLALLKTLVLPLQTLVNQCLKFTQLGQLHADLTPFLISRMALCGAGHLDEQGRFQLSDKAGSITSVLRCPEFSRAIFSTGQFLKPLLLLVRAKEVLESRQRVQISIGDSNLCEEAEYLRIGTTLLVIDAQEAGYLKQAPGLANPIAALHAINNDPTLQTRVLLEDGRSLSAIEMQRWYLNACESFVRAEQQVPERARDVLRRWSEVLDLLENQRSALMGRVDWITKQYLLKETASAHSPAARKKIDLKYHELTSTGYFRLLEQAGATFSVVHESDIQRATRLPPPGTPATQRALYIREFCTSGERVTWRTGRHVPAEKAS